MVHVIPHVQSDQEKVFQVCSREIRATKTREHSLSMINVLLQQLCLQANPSENLIQQYGVGVDDVVFDVVS